MLKVTVDASRARTKLRRLAEGIDQERMLTLIGNQLLAWVEKNFQAEGLEKKWKPLAPNTLAERGGFGKILQRTGRLRRSFGKVTSGNRVEVRSLLELAAWHHHGTPPYQIRPRSAKLLRFQTQAGTKFSHLVNHPGLPSRKLLPSERAARKLALKVAQDLVSVAVNKANRT